MSFISPHASINSRDPKRIISLVPSITELLCALGLESRLVGITKFCVHPLHLQTTIRRIGGTKNLHVEEIIALQPDLVIANKEENLKAEVERIAASAPVWLSDITSYTDALQLIADAGKCTGTEIEAAAILRDITEARNKLHFSSPVTAVYLIWKNPWMAAGGDTFIHSMMEIAGFTNLLQDSARYPEVSPDLIAALQPEVVLLSSEPYPFRSIHQAELQALLPTAQIQLVDGEYFSWYGSRMLPAMAYFRSLGESLRNQG